MTDQQINAALVTLATWSNRFLTDEERAAWRVALRNYRAGEFAQAIDAWSRTEHGKQRPNIGDLAQFLERPPQTDPKHQADYDRTQRMLAEQRKPVQTSTEHVADVLAKSRAQLAVERKPHAYRPEFKAAMLDEAKAAFRRYIEVATEGDEESQAAIDAWRQLAAILGPELTT